MIYMKEKYKGDNKVCLQYIVHSLDSFFGGYMWDMNMKLVSDTKYSAE